MATRRRAREIAMQLLYEADFGTQRGLKSRKEFVRVRLRNHRALCKFALGLIDGATEHRDEVDALLTKHATNWSLGRMAAIDRNILRLGCFEILHGEAPGRVAINEAIELAKRYGGRDSRNFVNGVLDRILRNN